MAYDVTIMANRPPVGNHLRSRRTRRGWSPGELARRSGLLRMGIGAIETGRIIPPARELKERMRNMTIAPTPWLVFVLAILPGPAASPGQDPAPTSRVVLRVGGDVPRPLELTAPDFGRLPRQTVRAKDHDGKEAEYEGVPLVEVLTTSGVKFGQDLRGPAPASYLVVEAADGYRAVFALPELDPAFTDRVILLADRRDGKPLGGNAGPLRVIVPGEKRHARWVRQVTGLRVGRG